jgi:hypothetical protein
MTKLLLTAVCVALAACAGPPLTATLAPAGAVPTVTPTPTPAPTASANASPTPGANPLNATPAALSLTQTGAATFTVTEVGYRGQYAVASSGASVVTVTTPVASSADTTQIAIDALAPGSANVTVTDAAGQSVTVPVGVTITPITIQRVGAQP